MRFLRATSRWSGPTAHGNEVDLPLIAGALKGSQGVAAVEDGDIFDRLKT
jgi:hypothetical protein